MKRIGMMALALAMGLSLLAGCGGKNSGETAYTTDQVQKMVDAGAFSEQLESLDGDTAYALYKLGDYELSREDLTDCAVLRSAGATCEEAAVLIFADSDKAEQAEKALKDYVSGQISANRDYRPNEIPKLEGALVEQKDNSVLLVVANDMDAAKGVVGD